MALLQTVTLAMGSWSIFVQNVNDKPIATLYVYYDAKNEIYPKPPTCIFYEKIESFYYCYNLYIYNLFNRAQFVSYFVSDFVSGFSDAEKYQIAYL